MGRYVWVKTRKNKASDSGIWSDKKKLEAVTLYLAVGKFPLVSAATGIPYQTVRNWSTQQWWKDRVKELQREETLELDAKLRKIVEKSLDSVVDILENGDYYYDPRTGKTKRIPPKLRDVQKVMGDTIDKRLLLRKDPVAKEDKQQITADHLVALAQEFAKMATGVTKPKDELKDVINGEVVEVYDSLGVVEEKNSSDQQV